MFAFLTALRTAGVDAPAPLGRDDSGRQVLEYVPGQLAIRALVHERDVEPWASMYRDGHGAHWQRAVAHVKTHCAVWARWLERTAPEALDG